MAAMASYRSATVDDVLGRYFELLEEEYAEAESFLTREELNVYCTYYPRMRQSLKDASYRAQALRLFARGTMRWLAQDLLDRSGLTLLDAGSGMGTESFLFSLLGAQVTGIDLRKERVEVANKRKCRFEEKLGVPLDVSFKAESVFSLDRKPAFDRIWVSEAISHIDPAEEFLGLAYDIVRPDGLIVITDSNGFFPLNQIRLLRERGLKIHTRMKVGDSEETVPYAVERVFSPGRICGLLRSCGFEIKHVESHLVGRSKFSDRVFSSVVTRLERLPMIGTLLGRTYVVAGRKLLR
jgi:2-polyprenyl-3-methyl-5-hydroxy-6-metoxy-1,4-benzoquinol methylase